MRLLHFNNIMYNYDLVRHLEKNDAFIDSEELRDLLKQSKLTKDEMEFVAAWFRELREAVDFAVEGLWESACEDFHKEVNRWYERSYYFDHSIPEHVDPQEFGKLVKDQVNKRFSKCIS